MPSPAEPARQSLALVVENDPREQPPEEAEGAGEAGARLLPLLAGAGGLAVAGARAAADALLGVAGALFRFQIAKFHVLDSRALSSQLSALRRTAGGRA